MQFGFCPARQSYCSKYKQRWQVSNVSMLPDTKIYESICEITNQGSHIFSESESSSEEAEVVTTSPAGSGILKRRGSLNSRGSAKVRNN